MALWLRQSTASQEVPLGYFLDSTDGNTEETGLSIANTDIKLWKSGATTLANKNSGGATHIANGIYYAVLDATDTNTLGPLVLFVHVAGALAVRVECLVVPAAVYDALIAGTDALPADVTEIAGAAVSAGTAQLGVNIVQISGDAGAADALEAALDGTGGVTLSANLSGNVGGSVAGSVASVTGNVGGNVNGSVASVAGAVGSVTGNVGGNVNGAIASLSAGAIDSILDDTIGDGTLTMRQALRVTVAALAAKLSGAATTSVTIRNVADTANVIVATVDASGNRTAVTVTP